MRIVLSLLPEYNLFLRIVRHFTISVCPLKIATNLWVPVFQMRIVLSQLPEYNLLSCACAQRQDTVSVCSLKVASSVYSGVLINSPNMHLIWSGIVNISSLTCVFSPKSHFSLFLISLSLAIRAKHIHSWFRSSAWFFILLISVVIIVVSYKWTV